MEKSNLDIAFELVSKSSSPMSFNDIWEQVALAQGLEIADAGKKAKFYTQLSLDGRFITLGENNWDLRTRYTFDKVHIEMNEVYAEDEEETEEVEDEEENEEESEEESEEAF